MKILLATLLAMSVVGCTSSDTVKELDDTLEVKGKVGDAEIGLNEDGEALIVEESYVADLLRDQLWVNNQLESRMKNKNHTLMRCREDLSDPRLGGSGDLSPLPDIDNLKPKVNSESEMGLREDGSLKHVKKSSLKKRLAAEKKYEKTLRSMIKKLGRFNAECNREMAVARRKAGLPSKRYQSDGYFTDDGTWIKTKKSEESLDDGFERAAKAKKRVKKGE